MAERGPWFISEADAQAREDGVHAQLVVALRRHIVSGMPDHIIVEKITACGFSVRLLEQLVVSRERPHG